MKVRNVNNVDSGLKALNGVEAHNDARDKQLVFQKTLTDMSKEQHHAHLKSLVGDIDAQGDKLSKRADIKEFEKYRRLIRDFVDEVVSNGYSFSKENTFESRGGRRRVFATVKVIDEKLDALAKEVLSGQADSLSILHKIDDIRGLIVDMML